MRSTLSKVFFSVSKGNDFNEDRIGTITSEFHEKELDADRIRTVADELEEEDVLLCDLCEFVLVESCSEDRLPPDIFTVCGCSLCHESVEVDFILSHVWSSQKFVACPVLSSPFLLLPPILLFESDDCLDCSPVCVSVVSFLEVLKR